MKSKNSITYYNRYTKRYEEEAIYGESFLRMLYDNPLGRLPLHVLVKRKLFSKFYGMLMSSSLSKNKIFSFIENYGVDTNEFAPQPEPFRNFNEFFYRKLKSECRPIAANPSKIVFPADGRHLAFQQIDQAKGIYVKGQEFNLRGLIGNKELAKSYEQGSMVISRLCPLDYHRFHFPCSGVPTEAKRIRGCLYSVSPIALKQRLDFLWRNERRLTLLRNPSIGDVLMIEVGATCVGKIIQTYNPEQKVAKGSEKGYFAFGGSCVITIFEPGVITFSRDLIDNTKDGIETFARIGDTMGITNTL